MGSTMTSTDVTPTSVFFQVFCYVTEDEEKVLTALRNILPEEIKDLPVEKIKSEGYYHDPIILIRLEVKKRKLIEAFLRFLAENFSERTKKYIARNIRKLIDDKGNLYLRLSKQDAYKGNLKIESRDIIWIKVHFRAYKDRQKSIIEYLKKLGLMPNEDIHTD